jgi:glutaredoxin-related protein
MAALSLGYAERGIRSAAGTHDAQIPPALLALVCYARDRKLLSNDGGAVPRLILEDARVHPDIRERIARHSRRLVDEVEAAIASHAVVVVGMALNPFPARARRLLDAAGVPYAYLGYGSYFSRWRDRLPLKMWTGWPTFPMVFVEGILVGGYAELARLDLAELKRRAAQARAPGA